MTYYEIEFTLTGWGTATVEADSQEEAEEKARTFDVLDMSEECKEWSFEDITKVEEVG